MTSCRRRSGYLGDDEASHTMYMARVRPSKKPPSQEMGQTYNLDYMPHPPSTCDPTGSPRFHSHNSNWKGPQSFGSFLDFLVEGQVLDSLQTVVEKATDRMASLKTEAGVPLVEVQDPAEEPYSKRHSRSRPRKRMAHQHQVQPSLCTGRPNNYPSCSSSASGSHNSSKADRMGSYYWDSNLSACNLGSLPPIKDRLLLEQNLKRLQRLENKGKRRGLSSSWGDFLLWDSLCSQTNSQWSSKKPLSWFTGLNHPRQSTLDAAELGSGGRNPILREIDKEIRSLLNQTVPLDLHGYCSLREPHHTLDFLVEHRLFPALQDVVNQAVDKLCRARCQNGYPLFPTNEWEDPKNARPPIPHKKRNIPRSKADSSSLDSHHRAQPLRALHITLPSSNMATEVDSTRNHPTEQTPISLSSPYCLPPPYHHCQHHHHHHHHHHDHHGYSSPPNLLRRSSSCTQLDSKIFSSEYLESFEMGLQRKDFSRAFS